MDIFDFRSKRVVNLEGVFDTTPITPGSDVGGLFLRLKNLLVAEIHTQWDIAFLETYIKGAMVPRSLRWEVSPQQGDTDLMGWFKYFNDSGVAFLRFLLTRRTDKLTRLDNEIELVKDLLTPFKNGDEYANHSTILLKTLDKEEKEQKAKKKKKFIRDSEDYKSNLVFLWQKKLSSNNESDHGMDTTPQPLVGVNPLSLPLPHKRGWSPPIYLGSLTPLMALIKPQKKGREFQRYPTRIGLPLKAPLMVPTQVGVWCIMIRPRLLVCGIEALSIVTLGLLIWVLLGLIMGANIIPDQVGLALISLP